MHTSHRRVVVLDNNGLEQLVDTPLPALGQSCRTEHNAHAQLSNGYGCDREIVFKVDDRLQTAATFNGH